MAEEKNVPYMDESGKGMLLPELEAVELAVPIKLNEYLESISNHYGAAFQDYTDGTIQIKSLVDTIDENIWNSSSGIVQEVTNGYEYIPDLAGKHLGISLLDSFVDESEVLFKRYMNYGDYALRIETMIALIEQELKEQINDDEEFSKIMKIIADDGNLKSLEDLLQHSSISAFLGRTIKGILFRFGMASKEAGIQLFYDMQTDIKKVLSLTHHWKLLTNSWSMYTQYGGNAKSPLVANSKITSSLVFASIYFGFLTLKDIATDQFTFERELVNLARAGVMFGAGVASNAVTTALISAGCGCAGLIGAAAGLLLSLVGNTAIDYIYGAYLSTKVTSNGLPREYEDQTIGEIKTQLEKEGTNTTTPTISDSGLSVYDVMNTVAITDNEDFQKYILQKYSGYKLLDDYATKEYDLLPGRVYNLRCLGSPASLLYLDNFWDQAQNERQRDFLEAYIELFQNVTDVYTHEPDKDINILYRHLIAVNADFMFSQGK